MARNSIRVSYDPYVRILAIEVPRARIVYMHALFESYDGLAVVRTIDEANGIISVIATESTEPVCWELLDTIAEFVPWRQVENLQVDDGLFDYKNIGV